MTTPQEPTYRPARQVKTEAGDTLRLRPLRAGSIGVIHLAVRQHADHPDATEPEYVTADVLLGTDEAAALVTALLYCRSELPGYTPPPEPGLPELLELAIRTVRQAMEHVKEGKGAGVVLAPSYQALQGAMAGLHTAAAIASNAPILSAPPYLPGDTDARHLTSVPEPGDEDTRPYDVRDWTELRRPPHPADPDFRPEPS